MHDDFKVVNYPKSMPSPELYARHFSRVFTGDVVDGFTLTPGTGLKVILAPGNTLIRYGSAALASARMVSLVAPFEMPVETPDASNPRIDAVVVYVDNSVELPGGTPSAANEDGRGVPAAKIVKGSPSANPTAPTATAIKAAIGSNNPYTVVGEVRLEPGAGVIAINKIVDKRSILRTSPSRIEWSESWTYDGDSAAIPPPGENTFATSQTIDVSELPVGAKFMVISSVQSNGGGNLAPSKIRVSYNGASRESSTYEDWYRSASVQKIFRRAEGVETLLVQVAGTRYSLASRTSAYRVG